MSFALLIAILAGLLVGVLGLGLLVAYHRKSS